MTAKEIRTLRKKLKLSREKFAALIGVSAGSVQNWEKRGIKPSPIYVEKIKSTFEEATNV